MEVSIGEVRDGTTAYICVVRDVGERRQLERALRHSQKMEAVGTLASGVAHDFNNLLQGILGCADLALGRLPEDSPAKTYIELLKAAARSGAGVVGQLMDFSGRVERAPQTVDLNRLISDRDTLLRRLVGEDITVRVTLGPESAPVQCDPAQLEQALMNLVVNARQAMPRGGQLDLETGEVAFAEKRSHPILDPGEYITLTVRDTGHGMDQATQRRVFEPFFTTKGYGKGTGLGLSSVYATVSAAGGTIDLQSQPDEGTTFTIYLPRSTAPVPGTEGEPTVGGEQGGETVLVTEDEPLVLASVQYYLERHGYRVLTARDVKGARKLLEEHPDRIDLLLTDVVLPDGFAPDVVPHARSHHPNLRILYMSAFSRGALLERHGLGGDDMTLQKPVSEAELLAGVRAALRQSWPPPPSDGATLPEIPVEPRAPALASDAHGGIDGRRRVLLVEDGRLARMAGCELLEDAGYAVTTASSAEEALDVWRRQEGAFDVVIADLRLGGMHGTEMLDRMRRDRAELPAVLMSARATQDAESWLERAPRTVFLEKPFQLSRVIEEIETLLG